MSDPGGWRIVEVPVALPGEIYAQARAAFYRETGAGRRDDVMPYPTPPGATFWRGGRTVRSSGPDIPADDRAFVGSFQNTVAPDPSPRVFQPFLVQAGGCFDNGCLYNEGALIDFGEPKVVWIRERHPWIPSEYLPPAVGPNVTLEVHPFGVVELRPVSSRYVIVSTGNRHELKDLSGGLLGWYTEAESSNFWDKLQQIGSGGFGLRVIANLATLVGGAVLTAVSGGLAAPLMVSAAANLAAGSVGAASGGNLLSVATGLLPSQVSETLAPILQNQLVQVAANKEVAPWIMANVAPEETAAVLREAGRATIYADVLGVSDFGSMLFRELAIRAQTTRAARDELRISYAKLQMEFEKKNSDWLPFLRQAIQVVVGIIGTLTGVGILLTLAKTVGDLAKMGMAILQGTELINSVKAQTVKRARRVVQDRSAEIEAMRLERERLEAEIAAMQQQPAGQAPTSKIAVVWAGMPLWQKLAIGTAAAIGIKKLVG